MNKLYPSDVEALRKQLETARAETDSVVYARDKAYEEIARLRKIEEAAVKVLSHPEWNGDDWYDDMCALDAACKG